MTTTNSPTNDVPRPLLPTGRVLIGDVLDRLSELPDDSIDSVVTSPPYFRHRNYLAAGQLGMEATVDQWVDNLLAVTEELRRVLKPTGSIFLNLGDSYSRHHRFGARPKSLLLGPERLAVRLTERGFIVRNKIAWTKTNPMPSSVGDRLASTWEPVYLLTISPNYWFDLDAIRTAHNTKRSPRRSHPGSGSRPALPDWQGPHGGANDGLDHLKATGRVGHPLGKNPGDVITTATSNYRGAHFATFPERLIEPMILAGCPERLCAACGLPWKRKIPNAVGHLAVAGKLQPDCGCGRWWRRGVVLDPFMGAGTTAVVAERLGRDWIGIDISADFARLTRRRLDHQRTQQTKARRDRRRLAATSRTSGRNDRWKTSTPAA